ncbi:MAG: hypothetical protein EU544_05575, partial [Promethearchaeota archaeon]
MTQKDIMTLFKTRIKRSYKENLLTYLSQMNLAHIKPKRRSEVREKLEESDTTINKIKELRQNLDTLFKKLKISENDVATLKIRNSEKIEFKAKDLYELINHLIEETEFFLNRIYELERYISKAKIELENIQSIKNSYIFLEQFHLTRNSLDSFEQLKFKVYTTYTKNLENLKAIFEFSEFPCVYQTGTISEDRIVFYIIYPKDQENEFKERLNIIHAEEIPILKKYLLNDGINFTRIKKELDLIETSLSKYENELERLRDDHITQFAAINEVLQNIEEYNWVERQFQESGQNELQLSFFVPKSKSEKIQKKLYEQFKGKINIETLDIVKEHSVREEEERKDVFKVSKEEGEGEGLEEKEEEKETDLREEAPTIMKNNPIVRPFELLTKMYGTPAYSEVDPTPFIAITFPLLFGLMFGDIGHGICLIFAGLVGAFVFRKKGGGIYNFSWIIFYCGIGAIFFGFMYGEFFGMENIEFFGVIIYRLDPISIYFPLLGVITLHNPLNNIMNLFYFAILIGVIHINLGWIIQFLNYWRQSRKFLAVTDSLFKIFLLTGGTILIFSYGFNMDAWLSFPYPILLTVIPGLLLIISKPI